ncbi:MAG TPA: hypothetical protein EYH34_00790 [Planctomycetes bacterium]|nr:hypothetical protein [Planctomycetota bacterium]
MRQLVAYWLQSGEFEQVMVQANISTRSSNGDVGRLYELGKRLLQDCDPGTPWKDAPLACRETALALVLESAHAIQQHYEQIDNRYRELREGGTYERLRSVLTTGFEELSSGNVFLSHSDINQLARQKLQEAFPDEPKEVLEQLARDLGTHIETTARASRHAFRLYVRYIVFGTKGFGTRDRFAQYEDYEQCRAAIEKAINTMIDQHPKYRNADRSAEFVKQLVGKQASDLANAIHKKK